MEALQQHRFAKRYKIVTEEKAGGATYTPKNLADFVARQIIQTARHFPTDRPLRVLDPAVVATLTTLVTMLVLGNILREIAIETFETLRVWWAG